MDDVDASQALIARNMLQSGDWVTARLDGVAFLDKAPLKYWITAIFYSMFGVRDWVARIPSALSAIALCWVTFLFWPVGVFAQGGFLCRTVPVHLHRTIPVHPHCHPGCNPDAVGDGVAVGLPARSGRAKRSIRGYGLTLWRPAWRRACCSKALSGLCFRWAWPSCFLVSRGACSIARPGSGSIRLPDF